MVHKRKIHKKSNFGTSQRRVLKLLKSMKKSASKISMFRPMSVIKLKQKSNKKSSKKSNFGKSDKKKKFVRRFGSEIGPGYAGQTSYPNTSVDYFNTKEPWVNASNWFYPTVDGREIGLNGV